MCVCIYMSHRLTTDFLLSVPVLTDTHSGPPDGFSCQLEASAKIAGEEKASSPFFPLPQKMLVDTFCGRNEVTTKHLPAMLHGIHANSLGFPYHHLFSLSSILIEPTSSHHGCPE